MKLSGSNNYSISDFGTLFKYVVVIAAYSFLVYKLITFNRYPEFLTKWDETSVSQFLGLIPVIILMPFNWFLEAIKWKKLVEKFQQIPLLIAYKAVLSGIITGFFTPNRIGELVGRIMFLDTENRKQGVTVSVVNSLTQNLIMAVCGIPAAVLFFSNRDELMNGDVSSYLVLMVICVVVFGLIYFLIPTISELIKSKVTSARIAAFFSSVSNYTFVDLVQILLITFLRYGLFCTQFYLMLLFFDVELTVLQALIAIPASYLFVTFTPSIAFSEAAVRSSYAVLFIGAYSTDEVSIILAGVSIWLLNFVIPMIVGSVVLAGRKFYS